MLTVKGIIKRITHFDRPGLTDFSDLMSAFSQPRLFKRVRLSQTRPFKHTSTLVIATNR